MNLPTLSLFVAIGLSLSCSKGSAADDAATTEIWKNAFVKRLDAGYLTGPLPHPEYPPPLELIFLSWDGARLEVVADYHNLTSAPIEVQGREIENQVMSRRDFYPDASLEVSNDKNGGWHVIGTSPSPDKGKAISVSMTPNSLRDHPYDRVVNRSCYIKMDAFRPLIGKYLYGRVVLKDGGSSQLLVLTDLLPPKEESDANNGRGAKRGQSRGQGGLTLISRTVR
jgi:hypothetical protein